IGVNVWRHCLWVSIINTRQDGVEWGRIIRLSWITGTRSPYRIHAESTRVTVEISCHGRGWRNKLNCSFIRIIPVFFCYQNGVRTTVVHVRHPDWLCDNRIRWIAVGSSMRFENRSELPRAEVHKHANLTPSTRGAIGIPEGKWPTIARIIDWCNCPIVQQ